jgi:hypothetical protein
MSKMSELDREVGTLDRMDRDDLRVLAEAQLVELHTLRRQVNVLKQELYDMTTKKNEMAKIATQGIVTVKGVK